MNRYYFSADGVTTEYITMGAGAPVLFLSGGGVSARSYNAFLQELSRTFFVVAPDLPGFGRASSPPAVWSLADYAKFIDAFLDYLGFESVFVVGHSLGGGIALELKSPHVRMLALVSPAGLPLQMSEFSFRWRYFVQKTLYDFAHYPKVVFVLPLLGFDFVVNRIRRRRGWPNMLKTIRRCLFDGIGERVRSEKVLILSPDSDELFPPEFLSDFLQRVPSVKIAKVSGNHDWILFRPFECVALVRKWFLSGLVR